MSGAFFLGTYGFSYPHPLACRKAYACYNVAMDIKQVASMGGKARAKKLSKSRRKRIAEDAAAARWAKVNIKTK
jgi:hypothetical protein